MTFSQPWALLLMLLAVPAWRLGRRRRPALARALGALAVTLAALAAAGVHLDLGRARPRIVVAVDASASLPDRSRVALAAERLLTSLPPHVERAVILFGRDAQELQPLGARGLPEIERPALDADASATDIENAIERARSLLAGRGAVWLVTDGRATHGEPFLAAASAARAGVRLHAVPVGPEAVDARVADLRASALVPANRSFRLAVRVEGRTRGARALRLVRTPGERGEAEKLVGAERVDLPATGSVLVEFEDRLVGRALAHYTAELDAPDAQPDNNRIRAAVRATGPLRVLVVAGGGKSTAAAALAGSPGEIELRRTAPDKVPPSAATLAHYSTVVIEDVPRAALDKSRQAALADYVKGLGGGLVTLGPKCFGPGGWRDEHALARVAPVRMEPESGPGLLVVFALDTSASMGRKTSQPGKRKLDLALDALASALGALRRKDRVAVVSFDDAAHVAVEPAPAATAAERDAVMRKIHARRPGRQTDIHAGLEKALGLAAAHGAQVKHVVLLSDGERTAGEGEEAIRALAGGAAGGVAISTVCLMPADDPGVEAQRALLADLVRGEGARSHDAEDAAGLAETLRGILDEIKKPGYLDAKPFRPVVVAAGHEIARGLETVPALGGRARVSARERATVVLATAATGGEPVLAARHAGLGRTVAFASSLSGKLAGDWPAWGGGGDLLRRCVDWCAAPETGDEARLALRDDARGSFLELSLRDAKGTPRSGLALAARVRSVKLPGREDFADLELALLPTAPGLYRARLAARPEAGVYPAEVIDEKSQAPVFRGALVVNYPPELARAGPDRAALAALVKAAGGALLEPDEVTRARVEPLLPEPAGGEAHALTLELALAALAAFLLSIAWEVAAARRAAGAAT